MKKVRIQVFQYGYLLRIFTDSVRMRENADKKNSEYRHFSRNEHYVLNTLVHGVH